MVSSPAHSFSIRSRVSNLSNLSRGDAVSTRTFDTAFVEQFWLKPETISNALKSLSFFVVEVLLALGVSENVLRKNRRNYRVFSGF